MFHATQPSIPICISRPRRIRVTSVVTAPVTAPATPAESMAAPIALGLIVLGTPVAAVAISLITALGA